MQQSIQQAFSMPEQASPKLEALLDEMYATYERERAHDLANRPAVPMHSGQCSYCAEVHAVTLDWANR